MSFGEQVLTLKLAERTKNCYRYEQEVKPGMPPPIRPLKVYVEQWATETPDEELEVIIRPKRSGP